MQVERGTGRYTGTTGTCRITVHIREIQFGEQEQTGTFTCTVGI